MNNLENNQRYLNELASMEKAFSAVPRPQRLSSCDCCHTDSEKSLLLNTPLKQLSGKLLGNFMFDVFSTIGDEDSFKYFLPRALELVTLNKFSAWCELGLLGDKLAQANYQQWPEPLSQAVDSMLRVIWQEKMLKQEREDGMWWIGPDYLCLVGNAVADIQPYLDDLFGVPNFAAVLWESEVEQARKGCLSDSFWRNEANKKTVIKWLLSEQVEELVMPIYLEDLNTRYGYK